MRLRLIAVGNKMPQWVEAAVLEYSRRLPKYLKFELVEISPARRGESIPAEVSMAEEARLILSKITPSDYCVALEVLGKSWSSEQLASRLESWSLDYTQVNWIVGGPDGLHEAVKKRANESWSLSGLTFAHPVVRVVLLEQLYRAVSIIHHHPYHRGG